MTHLMKTKLFESMFSEVRGTECFLIPLCFLTLPMRQLHWEGNPSDKKKYLPDVSLSL